MKNFLIQRITENDDYTETPSDLPINYIGGLPLPEFLDFLEQLGYDIKPFVYEAYYSARKDVPTKEIEDNPDPVSKHLYCRISMEIYLSDTAKLIPKTGGILISLDFNPAYYYMRNGFCVNYTPDKNTSAIIPESFVNFLLDIECKLSKIENASTLDQMESAARDLFFKVTSIAKTYRLTGPYIYDF